MSLFPFKNPQKKPAPQKSSKNQWKRKSEVEENLKNWNMETLHVYARRLDHLVYPVQNYAIGLEIDCQEFGEYPKQASR